MTLAGRNALVTGVSRRAGIGYAVARRLLEAGASVFLQGWSAHDATQAPTAVVEAARAALGPLDILVVNHARSGHGRLGELTPEEIDAFLRENVRASLVLIQAFAAQYDDSREGGRVALLTSGQHLAPMSREVAYAVSKGALQQATLTLADELADRRITVNAVNPGPTDTGYGLADQDPAQTMPLGRWGEPDD